LDDQDKQRRRLAALAADDPTVPCERRLLSGKPAKAIVRLSELEAVEVIVMATHGHTGLRRLLNGSVSEAVVRRAPCPVLTTKEPYKMILNAEAPPTTGGPPVHRTGVIRGSERRNVDRSASPPQSL
jgi:hypothetical protein